MSYCCLTPYDQYFSYIMVRTSYNQWNDNGVRFVQDQHANSLKQQSAGRHVAPLGHIIPIPSQPALFLLIKVECIAEKHLIWNEVSTMVEIAIFWFQIHITNGLNSLHRKWHTENQYMVKSAENQMRSNLEGCRTFRNLVVSYLDRDVSYRGTNV